jgi:hypothetical protein
MRETHLDHLVSVAKAGAKELPEIKPEFSIAKDTRTIRGFRTRAGTMAAEAQANRDLLVKHGLVPSVLDDLTALLDRFDQAVLQVWRAAGSASVPVPISRPSLTGSFRLSKRWTDSNACGSRVTRSAWRRGRAPAPCRHPAACGPGAR